MAAKNNCIKRDVCIFAKESFCKSNSECGHYIMEKGFTSTNTGSPKLPQLEDVKREAFAEMSATYGMPATNSEIVSMVYGIAATSGGCLKRCKK